MTVNILQTRGSFMLICPVSGQVLESHRPSVIQDNSWFQDRRGIGQVEIALGDINPAFTDEMFVKLLAKHKGNVDAALDDVPLRDEPLIGEKTVEKTKDTKAAS
jgi:hypothetical protein